VTSFQVLGHLRRGQRWAEQVALIEIASATFQECPLALVLNAFGYDREIERVRHHDDRAHERSLLRAGADVFDERLVDLQNIDRETL
jgi:hypothetical protein